MSEAVVGSITAANTGSVGVAPGAFGEPNNGVDVSISGVFSATLTLQKSYDNGVTWPHDLADITAAPFSKNVLCVNGNMVRVFCKPGAFVSGSADFSVRS